MMRADKLPEMPPNSFGGWRGCDFYGKFLKYRTRIFSDGRKMKYKRVVAI